MGEKKGGVRDGWGMLTRVMDEERREMLEVDTSPIKPSFFLDRV